MAFSINQQPDATVLQPSGELSYIFEAPTGDGVVRAKLTPVIDGANYQFKSGEDAIMSLSAEADPTDATHYLYKTNLAEIIKTYCFGQAIAQGKDSRVFIGKKEVFNPELVTWCKVDSLSLISKPVTLDNSAGYITETVGTALVSDELDVLLCTEQTVPATTFLTPSTYGTCDEGGNHYLHYVSLRASKEYLFASFYNAAGTLVGKGRKDITAAVTPSKWDVVRLAVGWANIDAGDMVTISGAPYYAAGVTKVIFTVGTLAEEDAYVTAYPLYIETPCNYLRVCFINQYSAPEFYTFPFVTKYQNGRKVDAESEFEGGNPDVLQALSVAGRSQLSFNVMCEAMQADRAVLTQLTISPIVYVWYGGDWLPAQVKKHSDTHKIGNSEWVQFSAEIALLPETKSIL